MKTIFVKPFNIISGVPLATFYFFKEMPVSLGTDIDFVSYLHISLI